MPSNNTLLKALDELFVGGLNSSHQEIINMTVSFWNSTFGRLETLDYPDRVQYAIRRLRPLVELDLPTFPDNFHEPVRFDVHLGCKQLLTEDRNPLFFKFSTVHSRTLAPSCLRLANNFLLNGRKELAHSTDRYLQVLAKNSLLRGDALL